MKERPIIFSGPMVRAIFDGRKTQTRRIIKPQPDTLEHIDKIKLFECSCGRTNAQIISSDKEGWCSQLLDRCCPYGIPGDRLWVRETVCIAPRQWADKDNTCIKDYDGYYRHVSYKADSTGEGAMRDYGLKWRPSIHMPKWATRLWLEVVNVRVERVQEMSYYDWIDDFCPNYVQQEESLRSFVGAKRQREMARDFWNSIHGNGAWETNPWVWVVEFKEL